MIFEERPCGGLRQQHLGLQPNWAGSAAIECARRRDRCRQSVCLCNMLPLLQGLDPYIDLQLPDQTLPTHHRHHQQW
jgi:hypothetical protein